MVWITRVTGTALTNGLMTSSQTNGIHSTSIFIANRSANTIQPIASFVIGTIFIVLTMSGNTGYERIALSTRRAHTDSLMILRFTQSIGATAYVAISTGIYTVLIDTGLVIGTIGVDLTFG